MAGAAPMYHRRNQAIEERGELDDAAMEAAALSREAAAVVDIQNPRQTSTAIRERALAKGRDLIMDYKDIARDQRQDEEARRAEIQRYVQMSMEGQLRGRDLGLREQAIRDERQYRKEALANDAAQLQQQGAYQQGQLAQNERAMAIDERKLAAGEREGQLQQFTPESVAAFEKSKEGGKAGDASLLVRDPMSGRSARPAKDTWDPKKNAGYYQELLKQGGYDTSVFDDRGGAESPESKRFGDTLNAMYQMDGGADLSHEELARQAAEFMKLGKLDQGSDGGQKPGSKVGKVISVNIGGSIDGPRIAAGGGDPQGAGGTATAPVQGLPQGAGATATAAVASQAAMGGMPVVAGETAPMPIAQGEAGRMPVQGAIPEPERKPMRMTVRGKTYERSTSEEARDPAMEISVNRAIYSKDKDTGNVSVAQQKRTYQSSPYDKPRTDIGTGINPKTGMPREARVAADGKWYMPDGKGGWLQVWDE